jgi:Tol biopolymer transport system component
VALFADGYFLTELPYFNPLNARCTRSIDGTKIAYSDPNTENEAIGQSRGGWIDLEYPEKLNKFTANQPINEMAFSPDGRHLAYTETDYSIYGNIYILDTESGETRELNHFETAYSLAWSPDGQELALITLENDAYTALVVDVKTGKITYSVHVKAFYAWDEKDKPADWPAPDWPGHAWGIQFPVTTRGLDGCYMP